LQPAAAGNQHEEPAAGPSTKFTSTELKSSKTRARREKKRAQKEEKVVVADGDVLGAVAEGTDGRGLQQPRSGGARRL